MSLKRKKKERWYALYRGDEFIDVDRVEVLAEKYGVKIDTIKFYSMPAYHNKISGSYENRLISIKLEEDHDEQGRFKKPEQAAVQCRRQGDV